MIIPTLNAAGVLAPTLEGIQCGQGELALEILVTDGGSIDSTRLIALQQNVIFLEAPRGRGQQLAAAAAEAAGDWLLFLHADTRLEPGWAAEIRALPPDVVGGAFRLALDGPGAGLRLVERAVDLRTRWLGLPYGDQALFARRPAYDAAGGFAPLPLMEDVDFLGRLRRQGRLAWLRRRAVTSARRQRRLGLVGAWLRNWRVFTLYQLGVSPERLVRLYDSPFPGRRGRPGA